MKKHFTLFFCCLAALTLSVAQPQMQKTESGKQKAEFLGKTNKEIPLSRNIEKQKPATPQTKSVLPQRQNIHAKGTDWYEPDTIITYKADQTPFERYIFTYVNGNYGTDLRQVWDGAQWENVWMLIRTHDVRNNLTEDLYKDWENGTWVVSQKNNYTYDDNDNRIEETFQSKDWGTGVLMLFGKNNYTYDAQKNVIEVVEHNRDWETGQVVLYAKVDYAYDAQNNEIDWFRKIWEDEQWVDDSRFSHTYDAQNNMTEEVSQYRNWETGLLENVNRITWTYDAQNNLTEILSQSWNAGLEQWMGTNKEMLTYDAQNNLVEQLRQYWDSELDEWANSTKYMATYDAQNNLKELIYQWADWETGELVNVTKNIYSYNAQNKLIEDLVQEWNSGSEQWVNREKWISTYDAQNNRIEELVQGWIPGLAQWKDILKWTFTYDDNHNTTSGKYQFWENNTWVDANNFIFLIHYNNMQITIGVTNCHRFEASYVKLGTISVKENTPKVTVKLYPNPTSGVLNIETGNNDTLPEIKIYSIQGALLVNTKGNKIDISSLPNGVYIASINGQALKVVKQ